MNHLRFELTCSFSFLSFFSDASADATEIMHHWSSRTNINTSIVRKDWRGKLATLWRSTSRGSVYMCVTLSTPLSLIVIQSSCLPPFSSSKWQWGVLSDSKNNQPLIYYLNNRSYNAIHTWRCVAMIVQIAIITQVIAFRRFLIFTGHVVKIDQ